MILQSHCKCSLTVILADSARVLPDTAAPVASDRPTLLYTKYADVWVDQLTESAQLAGYAAR